MIPVDLEALQAAALSTEQTKVVVDALESAYDGGERAARSECAESGCAFCREVLRALARGVPGPEPS